MGRAIFVGDPCQAIFGFTGADAEAIDNIMKDFSTVEIPLTVTYRCPKAIVRAAQKYVSHIEAHEDAPEGSVTSLEHADLLTQNLVSADAILCRLTAPLVKQAFALIKAGIPCHVLGRAIGQGLIKLAKRWKTVKSLPTLLDRLETYQEREVTKLMAKGRETLAQAIQDRVDCLKAVAENCDTLDCLYSKLESMFQDNSPTLCLSTVHKAKGKDWKRVFVLGQNAYMPSRWARQTWQKTQENNLIYVAYTRAMEQLVLVNVVVP